MSSLKQYQLASENGLRMVVTNYGARIVSLFAPDRAGKFADIVLGYDTAEAYIGGNPYFGAIIGRFANRISGGKFSLKGKAYSLFINNGKNTLHGGAAGFHNVFWKTEAQSKNTVILTYMSPDGEEGYPGNLRVRISYSLTSSNELVLTYSASTDMPTVINLTSHPYFNLAGEGVGNILDHELMINAQHFTPVNEELIPTGEQRSVEHTPFDFTRSRRVGERIDAQDEQLNRAMGYDHNWILDTNGDAGIIAARVSEPVSGRIMEVYTTEPGLQFYSGNFLEGTGHDIGKDNKPYPARSAFCLEAQHFPDSPNRLSFPSTVLLPGEIYSQKTVYRFLS